MATGAPPILIIGAGISGLTLAQACRKENLPFRIYERDESPTFRSAGWGLTVHWALPAFRDLLPEDIVARLPETYVNTEAVNAGEKGNFTFFDLSTGEAKWKVPAAERIRVSRERLRKLLLTGLDIEWSKNLVNVSKVESGVEASFHDGTTSTGSLLVACDGARSVVRRLLHPKNHSNYQLPVRFIGAGVQYPESKIAGIRNLDPYFLQGSDPRTDAYLWFSFLEAPGDSGAPNANENGERMYRCQVMTSWPFRKGFLGRNEPTEAPKTPAEMLSWMRSLSADWAEPFHAIVQNIPSDSEIKAVELTDWEPLPNVNLTFDGRVVLLGDAQHAMVMYRGEGANHAIVDVATLLAKVLPVYRAMKAGESVEDEFRAAVRSYEEEVVERTSIAVLASRQACLDAHDYKRLNDKSPLVRRRLMRSDLEELQAT